MNGKAVTRMASKSREPSLLCDDLPMAANMVRLKVSTIARRGRSSGVYIDGDLSLEIDDVSLPSSLLMHNANEEGDDDDDGAHRLSIALMK
mmetsp:Transcript_12110/g.26544  ORF Transcript_12110/g.26544 Transcript_12110/m.26544 type:complete len:91 (-) Transcript_12110:113-385(-)